MTTTQMIQVFETFKNEHQEQLRAKGFLDEEDRM